MRTTSAESLAESLFAAPATPTTPRLLGLDGRSGSGKTQLARDVARHLQARQISVAVVSMDDLYAGWNGLMAALPLLCHAVIGPLQAGRLAAYRRYDWERGCRGERVHLPEATVVIIEGVGSTTHSCREAFALTVWVQAPRQLRWERACARLGQGDFAPYAATWAAQEDELFGPDHYPQAPPGFDTVIDTTPSQVHVDG